MLDNKTDRGGLALFNSQISTLLISHSPSSTGPVGKNWVEKLRIIKIDSEISYQLPLLGKQT